MAEVKLHNEKPSSAHYELLSDGVIPKKCDVPLKPTESLKNDDVEEDDVFSSTIERQTNFNQNALNQPNLTPVIINTQNINSTTDVSTGASEFPSISNVAINKSTCSNVPTKNNSTNRRPSYTSKAPSALTNLPKTIGDINQSVGTLQQFSINSTGEFPVDNEDSNQLVAETAIRSDGNGRKDLLSFNQASFESLDEYSNPGTPSANSVDSPTSAGNMSQNGAYVKRERLNKLRTDPLCRARWEAAAKAEILIVKCRDKVGELHKIKFGSGSKGKSIKFGEKWYTPIEFEALSGRASCKDWKKSVRFHGQHLQKLIEDHFLTLHAISCACGVCCGDDTMTGPVKLSVRRKRSHVNSNLGLSPGPTKRKSFSDEFKALRERSGSLSVESDVFVLNQDETGLPPMTPLTPMTPITPHTPFGTSSLGPLPSSSVVFKPSSPTRSITLQVPATQNTVSIKSDNHNGQVQRTDKLSICHWKTNNAVVLTQNQANKNLHAQTVDTLNNQLWMQLEEMSSSIVSMANKLKLMIDQVKIQTEAIKDSAITQAKIQAENEKLEAISLIRRGQLQHALQAITSTSSDTPTQTQTFTVQLPKVCQNCGRDAFLECTGCYRSYYCGQFCQQKDWTLHKSKCRDTLEETLQQQHSQTTDSSSTHLQAPSTSEK